MKKGTKVHNRKEKHYSYFSRMLLVLSVVLTGFAAGAAVVIFHIYRQYEESRFRSQYEIAVTALSDKYNERLLRFHLLTKNILVENRCNPDLCVCLNAESYDDISSSVRSGCVDLLSGLAEEDRYLSRFVLYSPETGNAYYFEEGHSVLVPASGEISGIDSLSPFQRVSLSPEECAMLLSAFQAEDAESGNYEGIAASIFTTPNDFCGYLIPLYSGKEFDSTLSGFDVSTDSSFVIRDRNGRIVYSSNPLISLTDERCFTGLREDTLSQFQVSYAVLKSSLAVSPVAYASMILTASMTVLALMLYYTYYRTSLRNIRYILENMEKFSVNNLTSRIPRPSGQNEFTQIIDKFNSMCSMIQDSMEKTYVYQLEQKKSELYALQTSINPHFLYNTLETIRDQILSGRTQEAADMTLLLSKIFRSQTSTEMFVTIEEELEFCENLMRLYSYRFSNFDYDFEADDEARICAIPKNTLQPLIENFFTHGLDRASDDNFFELAASLFSRDQKNYIRITLSNNGLPISEDTIRDLNKKLGETIYTQTGTKGFAMVNVSRRLRLVFQNDCSVRVSGHEEGVDVSFRVELIFPALTQKQIRERTGETDPGRQDSVTAGQIRERTGETDHGRTDLRLDRTEPGTDR